MLQFDCRFPKIARWCPPCTDYYQENRLIAIPYLILQSNLIGSLNLAAWDSGYRLSFNTGCAPILLGGLSLPHFRFGEGNISPETPKHKSAGLCWFYRVTSHEIPVLLDVHLTSTRVTEVLHYTIFEIVFYFKVIWSSQVGNRTKPVE